MNSSIAAKMHEVQRSSETQAARCKLMLRKLKTIQLQEIEDYGEKQFETVIKVLADKRFIELKEAKVPDFLIKLNPPQPRKDAYEDEDVIEPPTNVVEEPDLESKSGYSAMTNVSNVFRENIKEMLLSTVMLGKNDDDTDSCSDYEDEVEASASLNYNNVTPQECNTVYLPVDYNPAVDWAKFRLDAIAKFTWLNDSLRTVDQRLSQQDQLLQYIKQNKPPLKFDESPKILKPKPVNKCTPVFFSNVKYFREGSDKSDKSKKVVKDGRQFFTAKFPTKSIEKKAKESNANAIKEKVGKETNIAGAADGKVPPGDFGGGIESLMIKIVPHGGGHVYEEGPSSRRCIPVVGPLRQRKVLQIGGIHNVVGRPLKQPSTLCSCFGRTELCIICSGRSDKIRRVRPGATARSETTALLDHNYHKTLSSFDEKPLNLLTEASLKTSSWNRSKNVKKFIEDVTDQDDDCILFLPTSFPIAKLSTSVTPPSSPEKAFTEKKIGKGDRRRKRKRFSDDEEDDEDEEEMTSTWTTKKSQMSSEFRKRRTDGKYDIDHIVIPYSIAAATRVEKIEYKEIVIPSWRKNEIEPLSTIAPAISPRNSRKARKVVVDEETEDVSLDAVHGRHLRSELDEKKRFMNAMNVLSNRRSRKSETKADDASSPSASPQPMDVSENNFAKVDEVVPAATNHISAADASLAVTALKISAATPQSPTRRRTISASKTEDEDIEELGVIPYEPRQFPLSDEEYNKMLKEMDDSNKEEERRKRRDRDSDFPVISEVKKKSQEDDTDDENSEVDDPDWRDFC